MRVGPRQAGGGGGEEERLLLPNDNQSLVLLFQTNPQRLLCFLCRAIIVQQNFRTSIFNWGLDLDKEERWVMPSNTFKCFYALPLFSGAWRKFSCSINVCCIDRAICFRPKSVLPCLSIMTLRVNPCPHCYQIQNTRCSIIQVWLFAWSRLVAQLNILRTLSGVGLWAPAPARESAKLPSPLQL